MNIQDFQKSLPVLIKHNIVPFIWGNQGIGKTQTVGQMARKAYGPQGFIHLHLATQEVGDLVGLLMIQPDSTVKHARPEWLPTVEAVDAGHYPAEGVVFLDELNRAHPDVIQAMFSFITSKTIHTHQLAPGWKIVAAGNHQSDQFNVTDTSDAAWMSRFCHITLSPTVQEFVNYAETKGAASVAAFISDHGQMLETKPKESPDVHVSPDRRSWLEMIAPLEKEDIDETCRFEIYSGIVGSVAASAFFAHKKQATKTIKLADILKDYKAVRSRVKVANASKDTRFDLLSSPIDELTSKLVDNPDLVTKENIDNLKAFFLDIPLELLSNVCKKLGSIPFPEKESLLNDPEFVAKLTDRS